MSFETDQNVKNINDAIIINDAIMQKNESRARNQVSALADSDPSFMNFLKTTAIMNGYQVDTKFMSTHNQDDISKFNAHGILNVPIQTQGEAKAQVAAIYSQMEYFKDQISQSSMLTSTSLPLQSQHLSSFNDNVSIADEVAITLNQDNSKLSLENYDQLLRNDLSEVLNKPEKSSIERTTMQLIKIFIGDEGISKAKDSKKTVGQVVQDIVILANQKIQQNLRIIKDEQRVQNSEVQKTEKIKENDIERLEMAEMIKDGVGVLALTTEELIHNIDKLVAKISKLYSNLTPAEIVRNNADKKIGQKQPEQNIVQHQL